MSTDALSVTDAKKLSDHIRRDFTVLEGKVSGMRQRLLEFRDGKGYRQLGYKTFNAWATATLPYHRSLAFRLVGRAEVEAELTEQTDHPPKLTERQLDAMTRIPRGERAEIWERVEDLADQCEVDKIDDRMVVKVVNECLGKQVKVKEPLIISDGQVCDLRGQEVTDPDLRSSFFVSPIYVEVARTLGTLKKQLFDTKGKAGSEGLDDHWTEIRGHFTKLVELIDGAAPYSICPNPECAESTQCHECFNLGWVTRSRFTTLSKKPEWKLTE